MKIKTIDKKNELKVGSNPNKNFNFSLPSDSTVNVFFGLYHYKLCIEVKGY